MYITLPLVLFHRAVLDKCICFDIILFLNFFVNFLIFANADFTKTIMDTLCEELDISKKQIRETQNTERFIVTIHKLWLKTLIQSGKILADTLKYTETVQTAKSWTTVYITVSCIHFFIHSIPFLLLI